MKNLCFGFLSLVLVWAGHAPAIRPSNALPLVSSVPGASDRPKETFWTRLKGHLHKTVTWTKGLLKRIFQSEREIIRLLVILLIAALIVSLVVWLLPWPLDVIVMVLALVVALIFLLRYLS